MDVKWPLAPVVVAVIVVVLLLWWTRRPRTPRAAKTLPVAHTASLFALPRYLSLIHI